MFEFLKSKKRKEKERVEKEALEARQKRLSQRNTVPATTQQINGSDYSAAYWMSQPSSYNDSHASKYYEKEVVSSNTLSEGSGSFSGAGSSYSWDDNSSSRSSSSSSSSYSSSSCCSSSYDSSSSDSSSSSSDNSSSCSSD